MPEPGSLSAATAAVAAPEAAVAARVNVRRRRITPWMVLQFGVLIALLFFSAVPIVMMLSMSLRPTILIFADFWGVPWPPTFQNYTSALINLLAPMIRTLFVYAVSIVGMLGVAAPAAYAFARLRLPGRGPLFSLVLLIMLIPGTILLVPRFILADQLGLRDNLFGLIVFYIAGGQPFAIFLLTAFFRTQPAEMFEAARIDGANEFQALLQIALPLAWPMIITLAILNFVGIYNDLIWPTLMLSSPANHTLIVALQRYNPGGGPVQTTALPDVGGQAAGYVFASIPQLLVFVLGMRYFIQGLTSGAVKA
ncbi:MAG: carbohydrate ABC transporter permease [Anaerolineales bacterium]|nr:carbohydrate ABC transporter permease [Anaerolineales bacterium]